MRRLSDRFSEAAGRCDDLRALATLLADATRDIGFDHFALLDHASLTATDDRLVRIDNYPAGWADELTVDGLAADDPVHLASRRVCTGFHWDDLGRLVRLEPRHHHILERGRAHGIAAGYTVPANIPGQPSASCSFAVRTGRELPAGRLHCAALIGVEALRATQRLRRRATPPAPRLSRREIECLRLVAGGKSDWEISRILGLSEHTVRQYVRSARAAYDVATRTQLAVHGLRDSWIGFDEAIPHPGE